MTMNGGTLQSSYVQNCVCFMVALFPLLTLKSLVALYLLKSLQGFRDQGFVAYAISIQVSLGA
jgi:hypothetical protein